MSAAPTSLEHAIFDSMTEGLIVSDLQGCVLDMNPAALRLHEYRHAAQARRYLSKFPDTFELRDTDGRPIPLDKWPLARALRGETFSGYVVHVRRRDTGTQWWGDYSGTLVQGEDGRTSRAILTVHDVTAQREAERAVQEARDYAENVVNTVREPMLVLDAGLRVVSANRAFYQTFRAPADQTVGYPLYELGEGRWDIPELRAMLAAVLPDGEEFDDFPITQDFPGLGRKTMCLSARKVVRPGNHSVLILLALQDITEQKAAEDRLRAAYEREKRIADMLQRPLRVEIPHDAFPGLSVATLYEAAWADQAEVGGDFYDAFTLADGRIAFLVGDVTGKGLAAAARATEAKDVIRAFLRLYPFYPALTLTRLNDYLCDAQQLDERGEDGVLCLALALVNLSTSEVTFAWGGIEPPLIVRAGGEIESLVGGGMLLGAVPHATYAEVTIRFRAGDTFLLSTDGLSEARQGKDFLGQEGVIDLTRAACTLPTLRNMGQAILDGARQFASGQFQDDACLVLVRRS